MFENKNFQKKKHTHKKKQLSKLGFCVGFVIGALVGSKDGASPLFVFLGVFWHHNTQHIHTQGT